MSAQKPSLAVIGTGLAGLSAAYLLKEKFEVTVYESQDKAGMGVHTIDYEHNGHNARIDVPLRIFCKGYYPNVTALYRHIGVEIRGSDHSGVFTSAQKGLMLHYGKFSVAGFSFAYPKGKSLLQFYTLQLAYQSRQFFRQASKDLEQLADIHSLTFRAYLKLSRTPAKLRDVILLPLLSVTLTCDYDSVLEYPAELILAYLTCGIAKDGIIGAEKGVDDIVPRLLKSVTLKVNSRVEQVTSQGEHISVKCKGQKIEHFDHVVIASQAQQAASMLKAFDQQQALLKKVPFERSDMCIHRDSGLLPKSRCKLSPVSYYLDNTASRSEVTVDLNLAFERYQHIDKVYQTWNPLREPHKDKELARIPFTRPIVTLESRAAMKTLRAIQLQPNNRLWLCGSYIADKIPLLDAAVDSSISVAKSLGATIPWETSRKTLHV